MHVSCLALFVLPLISAGSAPLPEEVRAIFRKHWAECQGEKDRKGRLELTTAGIARRGRNGNDGFTDADVTAARVLPERLT